MSGSEPFPPHGGNLVVDNGLLISYAVGNFITVGVCEAGAPFATARMTPAQAKWLGERLLRLAEMINARNARKE